jgi:hypothetical protein
MGTAKRSAEGQAEGQAGEREKKREKRVSFLELCADEELALGMFRSAEAKATITRKVAAEQGVGDCALVRRSTARRCGSRRARRVLARRVAARRVLQTQADQVCPVPTQARQLHAWPSSSKHGTHARYLRVVLGGSEVDQVQRVALGVVQEVALRSAQSTSQGQLY